MTSQAQYNHATATTAKLELKQNPGATAGLRMDYWIAFCLVKYLTAFVSESLLPKRLGVFVKEQPQRGHLGLESEAGLPVL